MGLKQNGRLIHQMPLRHRGAVGFEYADTNKSQNRNIYASEAGIDPRSGIPNGHRNPSSFVLPQKDGGISSYTGIKGLGELDVILAGGKYLTPSILTNLGTLNVTGSLLAFMAVDMSGTGVLSGTVSALLNLVATLQGQGDINGALNAVGFILANLQGDGTLNVVPYAVGNMSATITTDTVLSPGNLSEAVWNYLKTNPTISGSMKEELQKAKIAAENSFAVSS